MIGSEVTIIEGYRDFKGICYTTPAADKIESKVMSNILSLYTLHSIFESKSIKIR